MNVQEMSNEFDIQWNNIGSNQTGGINEYDKSVFLTMAEHQLTEAVFSPKNNKQMEGFEDSSVKEQMEVSLLTVKESQLSKPTSSVIMMNDNAYVGSYPADVYAIIGETVVDSKSNQLPVIPLSVAEYQNKMSKIMARPPKGIVWKIPNNGSSMYESAEYLGAVNKVLTKSRIRYIRRARPIILADVEEGLSIDGWTVGDTIDYDNKIVASAIGLPCELHPNLHHQIVDRAVELAKAAYAGDINSIITVGNNSGTQMGNMAQMMAAAAAQRPTR